MADDILTSEERDERRFRRISVPQSVPQSATDSAAVSHLEGLLAKGIQVSLEQ